MSLLIGIALSTLVSEDLALLAAGAMIAQGQVEPLAAIAACVVGIFGGDLLLYGAGRLGGRWLFRWSWVRRFLSEDAVMRASGWMDDRTFSVVFLSRFTPGLRLPAYVAAGLLGRSFFKFSIALLAAALTWTPLVVVSAAFLGETMQNYLGGGLASLLPAMAVAGLLLHAARLAASAPRRKTLMRRLRGFWIRKTRWEFWPAWLSYIPVVGYILALGVRYRSLTLFTAANPGIPCGSGFAGESKDFILKGLAAGSAPAADFALLSARLSLDRRAEAVEKFLEARGLDFPVVLKPDQGERGDGVAIIRSRDEAREYLRRAEDDLIIQEYVPGVELGIFYVRRPGDGVGEIFSMTRKLFPSVTGDGRRSLEELILADARAVALADVYLAACPRPAGEVVAEGERVQLIEIGSHCRGAIFLDGADLVTDELRRSVDEAAQALPGFYFGRFDVRSPSEEALQRGEFKILELNGVTAEAAHIYDPKINVVDAYRTLFAQWKTAFEIGAENRRRGHEPVGVVGLIQLIRDRREAGAAPRDLPAGGPIGQSA